MAEKNNLVVIDGDSMIYYVGSHLQTLKLRAIGNKKMDSFIASILVETFSKEYIGFFQPGAKCFRYDIAKTVPYKHNRSKRAKPEWYAFWAPILKKRLKEYWKFNEATGVESDDAVVMTANYYKDLGMHNKVIIASPDKDLLQNPDTNFYNYEKNIHVYCTEDVSHGLFAKQLILGKLLPS